MTAAGAWRGTSSPATVVVAAIAASSRVIGFDFTGRLAPPRLGEDNDEPGC